jgi:sugar phosphate isomerase/epimerase
MRIQTQPDVHLTYCLNIHPGEQLADVIAALRGPAAAVARQVAGGRPFGVGLRISAQAAQALQAPERRAELKAALAEHQLYAFTINGFPYGNFHGEKVKADVYKPDWRTAQRAEYTRQLADLLAELLPEGLTGSISTVPGSYRAWLKTDGDIGAICNRLLDTVQHMHGIRLRSGREIQLALEPEPACMLETTDESIAFFHHRLFPAARARGLDEAVVRRHLGICLDTCHAALAFEEAAASLRRLRAEGLAVPKVQLSAALRTLQPAQARDALAPFGEPVYLHQVNARAADGAPVSWVDLPNALADARWAGLAEARVHFHVPLFWTGAGLLRSTTDTLGADFFALLREGVTPHVEVETYTFSVLPWAMRGGDVTACVVRELEWTLERLQAAGGKTS